MSTFHILDRTVGLGQPPRFVAQLVPEDLGTEADALTALEAAAEAGAEAVDIQAPSILAGDVASHVCERAKRLGIAVVATHYGAADLESPLAPEGDVHGLAYPLIVQEGLVSQAAATQRPLLVSTEACELTEIEAACAAGGQSMAILHHVGGEAEAPANLHTLLDMSLRFNTVIGVTDHSRGATVAIAAVALGASIVVKPLALEPASTPRPAIAPADFAQLTQAGREAWQTLGLITYGLSDAERAVRARRSGNGNLLAG